MDPQALLADMDWLWRLAHRLVRDPALADDAVQEAWLAAQRRLAARGSSERPDRHLLSRTLRGMILHGRRGTQRRRFHEGRAARPEALPSTEELLLVGERQQSLWRHLRALEDPYRSTLLLRFQAELSPGEIAARSGDKEDTVRWRIRRGLELLKDSLVAEDGGPGLLGLVPVAAFGIHPWPAGAGSIGSAVAAGKAVPVGAALPMFGAFWMTHKFLITLGAAALLLAGAVSFLPGLMEPAAPQVAPGLLRAHGVADLSDRGAAPSVQGIEASDQSGERSRLVGRSAISASLSQPDSAVLVGRLLDEVGLPVAGARVVANVGNHWEREGTTNAEGRFELLCPRESRRTSLTVPAFDRYGPSWLGLGSDVHSGFPPLTVARLDVGDIELSMVSVIVGRVVDESGARIAGVKVLADQMMYGSEPNQDGEFRLEGVEPGVNRLRVRAKTYKSVFQRVELEAGSSLDVGTIVMERQDQFQVRGHVVDEAGIPIPGARVCSIHEEVIAGADGGFDFAPYGRHNAWLNATALGYRESATLRCVDGAEVELVVRELGALCQFLVVDEATGKPLSGASIRAHEDEGDRPITLGNGSWRYAVKPGMSPMRSEVETDHESSLDGRLDVHLIPEFDTATVEVAGYLSRDVVPTAQALAGEIQRIEMSRPARAIVMGTVPSGRGVTFPCVVELHTLESLRGTQWESAAPSEVGADDVGAWLGDAAVLRMSGRHRVHTDEVGRFEFNATSRKLVRAVCPMDEAAGLIVSGVVGTSVDEPVDVGPMDVTQWGTLRGRVTLPLEMLASRFELALEGSDKRTSSVAPTGEFAFEGLVPGRYLMSAKQVPDFVSREPFERVTEVRAGSGDELIIDLGLGEFAEVEFTLEINGAVPEKSFCIRIFEGDDYGFESSDWSPGPAVHMQLPVGHGYRLAVEPNAGELDNSGFELFDHFEVLAGKNVVHLEVESCHLVCAVPAKYLDPARTTWQLLRWKDSSGNEREPIEAGVHMTGTHAPDKATGMIEIQFPCVPVDAQDLRVAFRPWDDDDPTEPITVPFEAKLIRGERVRVELE